PPRLEHSSRRRRHRCGDLRHVPRCREGAETRTADRRGVRGAVGARTRRHHRRFARTVHRPSLCLRARCDPRARRGAGNGGGDMSASIGIGIIGLGHWGPNHLRVFNQSRGARVVAAADPSADRRRHVSTLYRDVELFENAADLLARMDVDAVVIATPARSHYALTKAALRAGKHVLLEKPMCTSLSEARDLVAIAARVRRALVHAHVFLYNAGIRYLRDGLLRGDFGDVQYLHGARTNLGPIRLDVNVVEDLATHEITIFD